MSFSSVKRYLKSSPARSRIGVMMMLVIGCLVLSSCGKRPGEVDPPVGAGPTSFPHTYPDLGTDPAP